MNKSPLFVVPPLFPRIVITIAAFGTFGCSSAYLRHQAETQPPSSRPVVASETIEQEIVAANAELEEAEPQKRSKDAKKTKIPIEVNRDVKRWIEYFSVKDRVRFQRFLDRGFQYKPLIEDILKKNGVPTELYYLAMIESGFVTHAQSHASAVGIWQFIRGTGKQYGLKQSSELDERRDVVRATESAAKYLKSLHRVFQSWYLAMAGYNAGERRILNAVIRGDTRDFWTLVEKKALPPETRNYVPKFLAAVIIGKNPEKYGFVRNRVEPFPQVELARVPGGVPLSKMSESLKVSTAELKRLNPHLLRERTPSHLSSYEIWVPRGRADISSKTYRHLATLKVKPQRTVASSSASVHRVRRGENLSQIARRYGTTVAQIKRLNRLRSSKLLVGQRLRVKGSKAKGLVYHRVRPGDALIMISKKYKVPVAQIKRTNSLSSSRIYVGQRLKIDRRDI